jgi:hypothetical protein
LIGITNQKRGAIPERIKKMKRINLIVAVKVGIYNTQYDLTQHKDGSITVREPYIKWVNNSGSLDFKKVKITDKPRVKDIKKLFAADELHDEEFSIDDYMYNVRYM